MEALEPRHLLTTNLVITELMADNDGVLSDQDGESPDWIEVTNLDNQSVDLDGWYLSDDPSQLAKWEFPATNLGVNQSVVVFASNKARNDAGQELHTNFTLDRDGEAVFLTEPDRVTIHSALSPFPYMPENVSFGRDASGVLGYFSTATPGTANGVLTLPTGAIVKQVAHSPALPGDSDDIVVTADVDISNGLPSSVSLSYRFDYGGQTTVLMNDTGLADDALAGDGIYTATIAANLHGTGDMVRWFVTTQLPIGATSRAPLWSTAVIDQSNAPEYFGTMVADTGVNSNLEVFQWFLQPGTESAAGTTSGTRASVFYNGQFYDNVFVRRRGGSTSGLAKKSFKFDFNQGHHFEFDSRYERVSEINLNTTFPDKSFIRQNLTFEVYDAIGAHGSTSFPVRIQRNGSFYSIATFIEQPDENLLGREGLDPDGALYKMFNAFTSSSNVEKKTRQYEGNSDLANFISGMSTNGSSLVNYTFDNVDIPAVINYLVGTVITQNNDQQTKNYYLYRDSNDSGEWLILPWDLDLTFGRHFMTRDNILDDELWADADNILGGRNNNVPISPSHPYAGEQAHPGNRNWNRLIDKLYQLPEFREMYLRRLRTAMDEVLQAPGTPYANRWMETRIDELIAEIGNDATLDYQAWANPWSYGQDLSITQANDQLKQDYLDVRRTHLYETHNIANFGQTDIVGIPAAQAAAPVITFGAFEDSPTSGNQDEEFIELVNPGGTAIDISGWRLSGGVAYTFRPGTVVRGNTSMYVTKDVVAFRARTSGPSGGQGLFVQGNYNGNLSAAGEQVELVRPDGSVAALLVTPDTRSDVQKFLRVTELHYHPTNEEAEFIEIKNIGSAPLDLTGVTIAEGPNSPFVFPASPSLSAGQFRLIVKNQAVFQATYPSVNPTIIAGTYSGSLSNSGERVTLDDANGNTVVDMEYSDDDPWPQRADGSGASLELITSDIDENSPVDKHYFWRGSSEAGGSPGTDGIGSLNVMINEVVTNSATQPDAIELLNTGSATMNVGGWYLSDSDNHFLKYQIPVGTTIGSGELLVFDENDFNPNPLAPGPNDFALNGAAGDDVWLTISDGAGGVLIQVDDVHFGPALENQSFIRVESRNGSPGEALRLSPSLSTSLGCENRSHHLSPIVISEMNYHATPPSAAALVLDPTITADDLDYVEITNHSSAAISLDQWRLNGGVTLEFPLDLFMDAGESVIVVGFDTTNLDRLGVFKNHYGLGPSIQIVGNYVGQLSNSGELIRLERPDTTQAGTPRVVTDELLYDDRLPWGVAADGLGQSLHRRSGLSYGNFATAWTALAPTPGSTSFSPAASGDLNGNGVFDGSDMDLIVDAVAGGHHLGELDFDADGSVDSADVTFFLEQIVAVKPGDANLDGSVDTLDFDAWNANRFGNCGSWTNGDFNGDRIVDVSDWNIWNTNQFADVTGAVAASTAAEALALVDVNGDGIASPLDALSIINYLNGADESSDPHVEWITRLDVDASGDVTPLDVMLVINHLNAATKASVSAQATDRFYAIVGEEDSDDEEEVSSTDPPFPPRVLPRS